MSVVFTRLVLASALLLGGISLLSAQNQQSDSQQTAPDNSKANKRDRSKQEPTADQQKENANDREITRKIRRAIMEDKSLSTYAHNIKIITQDGTVTLKGPVSSDDEKASIEAKAAQVVGQDHVTSQLEVKPKQQ